MTPKYQRITKTMIQTVDTDLHQKIEIRKLEIKKFIHSVSQFPFSYFPSSIL